MEPRQHATDSSILVLTDRFVDRPPLPLEH
jgi:hypothetical protein